MRWWTMLGKFKVRTLVTETGTMFEVTVAATEVGKIIITPA
jgi:hypothetical protein